MNFDNVEIETSTTFQEVVTEDRPASYWRLGESPATNPVDLAGSLSNASQPSGATATTGLIQHDANGAYRLDGAGWAVDPGDVYDFTGTAPFSFEAWVKPSTVDATMRRPATKLNSDGTSGWVVYYTSSAWKFHRVGAGVTDTAQWLTPPVVGNTYHVVVTYDGSTMRLYINGVLRASRASTLSIVNHTNPLRIGRYVEGVIDEPAVFPTALPASRIAAKYAAGI